MNPKITELKEDIAILQEKLNKLEEIEKRNAIPRMNLENEGKFDMVTYNNDTFYRLEYPTDIIWCKRRYKCSSDEMQLITITDQETFRLLDGVWYNDVQVKREKRAVQSINWEPKPQAPEEVEEGLRAAMRQAREEGVFDEPTKPMDEVVGRLEDKYNQTEDTPKTLYNLIDRWWGDILGIHSDWDMETSIEDLCDRIELWNLRNKND